MKRIVLSALFTGAVLSLFAFMWFEKTEEVWVVTDANYKYTLIEIHKKNVQRINPRLMSSLDNNMSIFYLEIERIDGGNFWLGDLAYPEAYKAKLKYFQSNFKQSISTKSSNKEYNTPVHYYLDDTYRFSGKLNAIIGFTAGTNRIEELTINDINLSKDKVQFKL
jgi:hypothetical protein